MRNLISSQRRSTEKRAALVTGASRGIGFAIAERLADEGFDLTISARNDERLVNAAVLLRERGGRVEVQRADMAVEDDVIALADAHLRSFDRMDVLVLAAGIGGSGELATYPLSRLDVQMSVNLRGPFLLVQRLLPLLRATSASAPVQGSRIIAVASITGVVSEANLAAYGASKAAMISLCESITAAEGSLGVQATAISPGFVDTDMTSWVRHVEAAAMIRVTDIAEMTVAITRLSRNAAIKNVIITRPGAAMWRP
jgi:3-oxoacyl-[acyl-carrier protein] reductase